MNTWIAHYRIPSRYKTIYIYIRRIMKMTLDNYTSEMMMKMVVLLKQGKEQQNQIEKLLQYLVKMVDKENNHGRE